MIHFLISSPVRVQHVGMVTVESQPVSVINYDSRFALNQLTSWASPAGVITMRSL